MVKGLDRKLDELVRDYRQEPDGVLFEVLVALAYAEAGWEVTLIHEGPGKSPDMRVRRGAREFFVECKRLARRPSTLSPRGMPSFASGTREASADCRTASGSGSRATSTWSSRSCQQRFSQMSSVVVCPCSRRSMSSIRASSLRFAPGSSTGTLLSSTSSSSG